MSFAVRVLSPTETLGEISLPALNLPAVTAANLLVGLSPSYLFVFQEISRDFRRVASSYICSCGFYIRYFQGLFRHRIVRGGLLVAFRRTT